MLSRFFSKEEAGTADKPQTSLVQAQTPQQKFNGRAEVQTFKKHNPQYFESESSTNQIPGLDL